VVVLGRPLANLLFPTRIALGKTVRINGSPYEVVGVFGTIKVCSSVPVWIFSPSFRFSTFKKEYPAGKRADHGVTVPEKRKPRQSAGEVIQADPAPTAAFPAGVENDF